MVIIKLRENIIQIRAFDTIKSFPDDSVEICIGSILIQNGDYRVCCRIRTSKLTMNYRFDLDGFRAEIAKLDKTYLLEHIPQIKCENVNTMKFALLKKALRTRDAFRDGAVI